MSKHNTRKNTLQGKAETIAKRIRRASKHVNADKPLDTARLERELSTDRSTR